MGAVVSPRRERLPALGARWELSRVVQLRPDLPLPNDRRQKRRALHPRALPGGAVVADRARAGGRRRPLGASGRPREPLPRRRAGLALELLPLPRRARRRAPAGSARGDLPRPARGDGAQAVPVGVEGEPPPRGPSGVDRDRSPPGTGMVSRRRASASAGRSTTPSPSPASFPDTTSRGGSSTRRRSTSRMARSSSSSPTPAPTSRASRTRPPSRPRLAPGPAG